MADTTPGADPVKAPAPAIVWPYLLFGPLAPAVALVVLAVMMAKAVHTSVVSNMAMAILVAYGLFGPICCLLALIHRQLYRQSGRHRLWPVLCWALMFGATLAGVVILTEQSISGFPQAMAYTSAALGGMTVVTVTGYLAVRVINRGRKPAEAQTGGGSAKGQEG